MKKTILFFCSFWCYGMTVASSFLATEFGFTLELVPQPTVQADPFLDSFTAQFNDYKIWVFMPEKIFFDTVEVGYQELYSGFFQDFVRRAPLDWGQQDVSSKSEQLRRPLSVNMATGVTLAYNFFPVKQAEEQQLIFFACLVSKNRPVYFLSRLPISIDQQNFLSDFIALFQS